MHVPDFVGATHRNVVGGFSELAEFYSSYAARF